MLDVATEYPVDKQSVRNKTAAAMFEVLKDDNYIYAENRKNGTWNSRQLAILAYGNAEANFETLEVAASYLKASKASTKLVSPSSGSLGQLSIGVNNVTILRFVISDECLSTADIVKKFDVKAEIATAKRMFEVLKDPDSMFAPLIKDWSEEECVLIAKQHAAQQFISIAQCQTFLQDSKLSPSSRPSRYTHFGF